MNGGSVARSASSVVGATCTTRMPPDRRSSSSISSSERPAARAVSRYSRRRRCSSGTGTKNDDSVGSPSRAAESTLSSLFAAIDRMVQRQQAHAHAQAQRARSRGQKRGQHLRRRAEAVVVEMVLGDPHRLIAERLGREHLLDVGLVYGPLAPPLVALHQEEEPEVHWPRMYHLARVATSNLRRLRWQDDPCSRSRLAW